MENDKNDILTAKETAELLRIPRSTVYKLAQAGLIPAQRAGQQWRFYRPAIIRWLSGQFASHGTFTRGIAEAGK